jgi:hypothetical protein
MSNYEFAGIAHAEAQDRHDEYRTGVPSLGGGQVLLDAPAPTSRAFISKVHAFNSGEHAALLRLRHQGTVKSVAAEILSAFAAGGNRYAGSLQNRAIVPGTIVITEAGAPVDIVDDGAGVLHDIGIPANTRGTVNYATGVVDFTWGAAATDPVTVAYDHTDAADFASAAQAETFTAAAAYPETFQTGIGRVNPGSVTLGDGALTFVDDGKGNMIETTGGVADVQGTVDYGTGVITLVGGTAPLNGAANAVTIGYTYNPFASLLAAGGGQALADLYNSQIPELTNAPWAAGINGESRLQLWGESRATGGTNLITKWYHASEDPLRVEAPFSGFPPGGNDNDPRLA